MSGFEQSKPQPLSSCHRHHRVSFTTGHGTGAGTTQTGFFLHPPYFPEPRRGYPDSVRPGDGRNPTIPSGLKTKFSLFFSSNPNRAMPSWAPIGSPPRLRPVGFTLTPFGALILTYTDAPDGAVDRLRDAYRSPRATLFPPLRMFSWNTTPLGNRCSPPYFPPAKDQLFRRTGSFPPHPRFRSTRSHWAFGGPGSMVLTGPTQTDSHI